MTRESVRMVLLGTAGGPGWGASRRGIASALVVGDRFYLVDAGEGVGTQLRAAFPQTSGVAGVSAGPGRGPLDRLRAVFITHLHSDHVVGLSSILTTGLFNGLDRADGTVEIWGPGNRGAIPPLSGLPPAPPVVSPDNPTPGTAEMVDLLVRAHATDYNDRSFDNRKSVPSECFIGRDVPVPPEFLVDANGDPHPRMSPVSFYEDDRVRVSVTLVQHAPVFPALAFRFDTDDGAVVFSGDTAPSENLVELAYGADILVHEVIAAEWVDQVFLSPRDEATEGLRAHLLNAHTTIEQVGPLAERAGVRTLVLSHIVPADWPEARWQAVGDAFSGQLVIGRDLDEITMAGKVSSLSVGVAQ